MNNVREIARINERELDLAVEGAGSWHDDYKDSAYIFIGNLDKRLTEGDVIAIFSQYGEVLDINLPRIPRTGSSREGDFHAPEARDLTPEQRRQQPQQQQGGNPGDRRGFGFLLYEDQRSTVLAVDNLNGFNLIGRTLRVDHVRDYKMPGARQREQDGDEDFGPSRNAAPQMIGGKDKDNDRGSSWSPADQDDEDPMAAYFRHKRRSGSRERDGNDDRDSKDERKRRKEERRLKREERDRRRALRDTDRHERSQSSSDRQDRGRQSFEYRSRERSPDRRGDRDRRSQGDGQGSVSRHGSSAYDPHRQKDIEAEKRRSKYR